MAIILGKGAHTHDPVQASGGFIAVALAKLTKTQRQVTVTFDALLENQNVPRAIHRLQGIVALFRFGHKHVFTVLVPVTRFLPQVLIQDLRNEKITYKIREHSMQKLPYILVVGDKEKAAGAVAVRARGNKDLGVMSLEAFEQIISNDIALKS